MIALAPRVLVEGRAQSKHRPDPRGATAVTAGLVALVFGLSQGGQHSFSDPRAWVALLAAAISLVAFVVIEQRVRDCIATSAQLATRFVGRIGVKPLFAGGLLLASGGMALLSGVSVRGSYAADALPGLASAGPPPVALVAGFQAAFRVAVGFGIAGAVAVAALVRDDACVAELRRRSLRALVHRQIAQPVTGQTSPCWPAVADLHNGQANLPAEATAVEDA